MWFGLKTGSSFLSTIYLSGYPYKFFLLLSSFNKGGLASAPPHYPNYDHQSFSFSCGDLAHAMPWALSIYPLLRKTILVVSGSVKQRMDPTKISLRPFKLSDVDDFMVWASDDRVTHSLRWNTFASKEHALNYIKQVVIPHPWRRSICLNDRSIGYVSVKPESGDGTCRAHIGYALAVEYWGQGITTIALKMALSSVFKEMPYLVRVQAFVEVENKASQRVLEKVGFLREGLLRKYGFNKGEIKDLIIYSFLSTDPLLN
ncbi:uncharacterized N-acetyltransferase p20-like [Macadamia integrifolia]|uniref:uncharacterized N-acetyltransferase p20-like n=1 Tax=Macadamia integrifolia TaxID=60698 RepID=UPI001C532204|nr:uncharacterized N-acetyltransferase p20-like [Macadamia integrifolia]